MGTQKKMKNYYTAVEVADMLGVCTSTGYRIIRELNDELKRKGYITIAGRVSKAYFKERTYQEGRTC